MTATEIEAFASNRIDGNMAIFKNNRLVPFRAEEMFDMVSDVERYPEFLPGWHRSGVLKREGAVWDIEQEVGFGPFRMCFRSRAVFDRPKRIEIVSTDDPFRKLEIRWSFEPSNHSCCLIDIHMAFTLRSALLKHLVEPAVAGHWRLIVSAFEERAYAVYSDSDRRSECG
ncbi:MAG: type II toxin-antitoxin system RatA family toxin [Desulfobacteraceae bacterium]|nr:MAG: type II toxin-antitoxin system RatA family toxin [Desulfobacteraceae bacterium]